MVVMMMMTTYISPLYGLVVVVTILFGVGIFPRISPSCAYVCYYRCLLLLLLSCTEGIPDMGNILSWYCVSTV